MISGKPPYTFQWIPEDNLADPTAQTTAAFISESSVYHVVATDGFGCGVDTATVTVTITNPPLGIGEVEDSPVKVYPNPVDGELHVAAAGVFSVELYNTQGQKLYVAQERTGDMAINTEAFASGLYYLRVATAEGIVTKAVVVK